MAYSFTSMSDDEFEKLVVNICRIILGVATEGYAKGKDAGLDALFVGTAEKYPSSASPWSGTIAVQAKHTSDSNASYSDKKFYSASSKNALLNKELPKIKELVKKRKITHYMLFANRRKTSMRSSELKEVIAKYSGLNSNNIAIISLEELNYYCSQYPEVIKDVELYSIDAPLDISPNDLTEFLEKLSSVIDSQRIASQKPTERISFAEKNKLNHLSTSYSSLMIRSWAPLDDAIRTFLGTPANRELLDCYMNVVDELQRHVIAWQDKNIQFADIMNYLLDWMFKVAPELQSCRNLAKAVIFYMYFNCDIGKKYDEAV